MRDTDRARRRLRPLGTVLVNWERPELTIAALQSLLESTVQPGSVVVVDSASSDDSVERLRQWASSTDVSCQVLTASAATTAGADEAEPWLTIIVAASNRGFSAGNNLGLRYLLERSHISHVLLLNNDARVHADCIAELGRALVEHGDAGIITGTIYVDSPDSASDPDDSRDGAVWYAGGREVPLRGLMRHLTTVPADAAPRPTEFVSGCAMVLSRATAERIGLLAECYDPGYWEDAEYSRRAREAGFAVLYFPRMRFYHRIGASIGPPRASPRVTYVQSRNRLFYIRRNYSGLTRIGAVLYNVVTKPGRALLEAALGRPRIGWAVLRGTARGMFGKYSA